MILIGVVDIYFHKQNQRQMLVSPEYPLKKEVVAKALEDCDVSCVIEEHSPTEQSLSFSLRDEETNFLYAGIKTQKMEGIDCEVEFQLMPEQQRYVMKIGFID